MKKRWIRIISMAIFVASLMIQAGRDRKFNGNIQEETAGQEEQNMKGETEETEQECNFKGYEALDVNLFGSKFLCQVIVDRAAEDMGEGKEEVVPVVSKDSSFPEGLVVKMEEVLHQIRDTLAVFDIDIELEKEVRRRIQGDSYTVVSIEFGLYDFRLADTEELSRLFPKAAPVYYDNDETFKETYEWISRYYDIPEDTDCIYHMELLPGKDNYLFECRRVGIQGNRIRLTERIGDEFHTIYEFDIPNTLLTGVTRYEDKFYFIAEHKALNVDGEDGITIYRLSYDSPGDNIRILYQPEEYAAEKYDTDSAEIQLLIESGYMDKVLEDFSSGKYLHEGNWQDGAEIYYGDEERVFKGEYEGSAYELYRMDIANCGCPVYLCKEMFLPQEDDEGVKNLGVDFFYYDTDKAFLQKLEELSIPMGHGEVGYLVQMWFKEMEGKVYTFRIYNLARYNYLINIALVEGDEVVSVGTYFLWPRKKFILEENVVQGGRVF